MSSIEAMIAENTKAMVNLTESLNKSNDLTERMIGLKSDAIETVKQVAGKPETAAAKPKASETKAAPTETKDPAPEEKKLDPIAQAISDYVGGGYDLAHPQATEERKARSAKVKAIFQVIADKGKVEVKNHADIPEAFHGAFLKTLAKRVEEGSLVIGKDAGGEEIDLDS